MQPEYLPLLTLPGTNEDSSVIGNKDLLTWKQDGQQFSMLDLYSYKQSGLYRMFKNFMVSYTWLHMYPKF